MWRFTEYAQKNRILFWQLILRYLQAILWDLGKNCFNLIKTTVADQFKNIYDKIIANQAQYDLDRLAAKISACSFGDLRKYEYLTGEDLGYKPSVVEQAKFGLDKDDQKEGLFKKLKIIEDVTEKRLNTIENQRKKESDKKDSKYSWD